MYMRANDIMVKRLLGRDLKSKNLYKEGMISFYEFMYEQGSILVEEDLIKHLKKYIIVIKGGIRSIRYTEDYDEFIMN